ncbi:MAG: hypothetical protein K2G63_06375 [Oscillospiraceae bacterium]|nr:hypothetical protein [Oscillospiraceae bacterium]
MTSALPIVPLAEERLTGDINGNGILNAYDANMVLEYYARDIAGSDFSNFTDVEIENIKAYGDVTNDGIIDAGDAADILYMAKNYINSIDVNDDGKIDIYDAKTLNDFIVNFDSYSDEEIEAIANKTVSVYYDYGYRESTKRQFIRYVNTWLESYTGINYDYKDVNGDGLIDVSDASDVLRFYAEKMALEDKFIETEETVIMDIVGDTNHDGMVDDADASDILHTYVQAQSGRK